MPGVGQVVGNAYRLGTVVPAFNVPYLPMIQPVIQAVADLDSFALVETARIEWLRFECQGARAVRQEFARWDRPGNVRLHLDHIPVIDEGGSRVDCATIIQDAIDLGYHSVMVDGSALDLAGNIQATQAVVAQAHAAGIPCEAEYLADYCRRTGRTKIEAWSFYLAFSLFRLAAIAQGILGRALQGNASSESAREVGTQARALADAAWRMVQEG